jgi:tRNA-splicing ligase RtcB
VGNLKIKGKDLLKLGFPNNKSVTVTLEVVKKKLSRQKCGFREKSVKKNIRKP